MPIARIIYMLSAAAGCWLWGTEAVLAAETSYVGDQLVITVRSAPRGDADIVTHVRTGDVVSILERPSASAYVRIRTADGREGWSQHQYLVGSPTASVELERLQAQHEALSERHRQTLAELEALQIEHQNTQTELDALKTSPQQAELTASESVTEGLGVAQDPKAPAPQAGTAVDQRAWFIAGAGVLVAGMVLGLIIGWIMRRRRWVW